MSEITLGGYTLTELKKMQRAVAKDAQSFIATHLENAKEYFAELKDLLGEFELSEHEITTEMTELARKAHDEFKLVKLVSDIGGVTYYIPWDTEWNSSEVMSCALDNAGLSDGEGVFSDLYDLLTDMESTNDGWHNSRC